MKSFQKQLNRLPRKFYIDRGNFAPGFFKRYFKFFDAADTKFFFIKSELIKLLRKLLSFFYIQIFNRLVSPRQQQIIKYRMTPEQKKFFYKLFKTEVPTKNKIVYNTTCRLYNLGFIERPLNELHEIMDSDCSSSSRRLAAWELSRWFANQRDEKGAYNCLGLLSIADQGEGDQKKLRQNTIMRAECYERVGDLEQGKKTITEALERLGPEANLFLTAANYEDNASDRLVWINKALKSYRISPISIQNLDGKPLFHNLKPGICSSGTIRYKDIPLVSIIMPVYNAQDKIGSALESVLAQTWPNIEVLVVDDCSTDNTASTIEEYVKKDERITLIKVKENRGTYEARNVALKMSKGKFVTTHDADDWSHPEKIEIQVKHLMKNPLIVGNTSQMVQTTSDLNFYRKNHDINLISDFPCSFMFRRKPVMQAVGYWDSVRFAADNEYIRRIKKHFGSNSIVNLKTGPLTFYRQATGTLTGNKKFGYPGYYMGIRKEYYEAQMYSHNKSENLYYSFPQQIRPFPVPEPMWINREAVGKANINYRYFDLVFVSDFRHRSKYLDSIVTKINEFKKDAKRIGLVQMYCYEYDPKTHIASVVREILDGDLVQMIVYGEHVYCGNMVIFYPPVLMEKQLYIPHVKANEIKVLATYAPAKSNIEYNELYYDIGKCERHLKDYFGKHAIWYALTDSVLKDLHRYHKNELKEITISDECFLNHL